MRGSSRRRREPHCGLSMPFAGDTPQGCCWRAGQPPGFRRRRANRSMRSLALPCFSWPWPMRAGDKRGSAPRRRPFAAIYKEFLCLRTKSIQSRPPPDSDSSEMSERNELIFEFPMADWPALEQNYRERTRYRTNVRFQSKYDSVRVRVVRRIQ